MAQANLHQSASENPLILAQIRTLWRVIAVLMLTWHARAKQRRELRELEPWVLRDLGLSKLDAAVEAAKPFWRP